jgi:hypothetical protein
MICSTLANAATLCSVAAVEVTPRALTLKQDFISRAYPACTSAARYALKGACLQSTPVVRDQTTRRPGRTHIRALPFEAALPYSFQGESVGAGEARYGAGQAAAPKKISVALS